MESSELNDLAGLIPDMALKDRIQELIKAGFKKGQLARAAGKSPAAVTHWLNGETKEIKSDSAAGLQALTGYSSVWISTGKGPRQISEKSSGNTAIGDSGAIEFDDLKQMAELSVPLLSWVRAGEFCDSPSQFTKDDAVELLPRPLFNTSSKTFALAVRGDSMDAPGGYREGEIVYIDPEISPTPGRDVLARVGAGMTLKRYKEDEEGPYLLQLNGNKIIRPAHWYVCGVVVFSGQKR